MAAPYILISARLLQKLFCPWPGPFQLLLVNECMQICVCLCVCGVCICRSVHAWMDVLMSMCIFTCQGISGPGGKLLKAPMLSLLVKIFVLHTIVT